MQLGNGFAISHLRFAHLDFDAVRTAQDVHFDVEMQLAHALDQRFARIFVGRNLERGVFLDHLVESNTEFLVADPCLSARSRLKSRDPGTPWAQGSPDPWDRRACGPYACTFFMPRRATISPACAVSSSSRESACISTIRPIRSVLPVKVFNTLSPLLICRNRCG